MTRRKTRDIDQDGADGLAAILAQAKNGDRLAVTRLRDELDQRSDLWQQAGDLALHAEAAWIALVAGEDRVLAESLQRKLEALKAELTTDDSNALESLLIARIAMCWLQAAYCDLTYAKATECSMQQAGFLLKRQAESHRRFLNAVRTLATVRSLIPANRARE